MTHVPCARRNAEQSSSSTRICLSAAEFTMDKIITLVGGFAEHEPLERIARMDSERAAHGHGRCGASGSAVNMEFHSWPSCVKIARCINQ